MSTDVAIYRASVPDRMQYAQALAQSGLLPDAYRGKPANILVALEYGAGLGIPPMTAIQQVHIVQGKPVASAQLIGALVRKAGHRLRVTGDDKRAVCEIVRADDPDFTFRSEWTIERAQQAKLTGKETWRAYPGNMLRARAITECARDACPEALAGISYTAEELGADDLDIVDAYPQTDSGAAGLPARVSGEAEAVGPDRPQEATAAPESPDIVDAVLVDDATDGAGAPAEPGRVTGQPDADHPAPSVDTYAESMRSRQGSRDAGGVTKPQLAKLGVLLRGQSRDQALAIVSSIVGRDIGSRNDLTMREAGAVIDALEVQDGAA